MRRGRRQSGLIVVMMFSAAALFAQSTALNPTVRVLPQARTAVPPDCEDLPPVIIAERAPAEPRPQPPIQLPAEPVARPAADIGSELRAAIDAVASRNRPAFDAAYARARAALAATAPGAQRTAAADVLAVLDDVALLWDYQFNTPTGAFFDAGAQNGAILRALTRYPGYESFVRPHVIVDANGNRFFPTGESIDFLLDVASERLRRTGVRVTPRAEARRPVVHEEPSRVQPTPAPTPPAMREPSRTTPSTTLRQPQPQPTTPAPRTTAAPTQPTPTRTQRTTTQRTAPRRSTARPPAQAADAAPPAATSTRAADDELPVTPGVVSTPATATDVPPAADPAVVATETAIPDTTGTPAVTQTAPADPAATAEQPPRRGRGIVLPIVLILIGVGVLIILFRTSA